MLFWAYVFGRKYYKFIKSIMKFNKKCICNQMCFLKYKNFVSILYSIGIH